MAKLANKVTVITGGNQGIGKGIARVFAAEGSKLAICARNAEKLSAAADELRGLGVEVLEQPTDVTDEAAVDAFFEAIMKRFGRVDILVNNAGAFDGGRIDEVTLDGWNNVIGACLTGAFLASRAAFRIMKEQGGGRILNIGSISAQRPREGSAPYAAAKFGIWGLTMRANNVILLARTLPEEDCSIVCLWFFGESSSQLENALGVYIILIKTFSIL